MELLRNAGLDGLVLKNLEELEFLKGRVWEIPLIGDHNLYGWNQEAIRFWREQGVD